MTRLILIATVFMLVSGPVLGQTKMVPLADYIAKNPKIDIKNSEYIFSRCAAFYVSMIPLLQDTDQVKVQTVRKMTIASAKTIKLMEKRTGGSFKALTATAMKTIKDMA